MFLNKALSWGPPELFYKVIWWRGSPLKKEEDDEGLVKKEAPPPMEGAPPAREWLKWRPQVPAFLGYLKWWGQGTDSASGAPTEQSSVEPPLPPPSRFGVQQMVAAAKGTRWGSQGASRPSRDLETPEHFQICFNFIRHLVDLCVLSFLWLSSPVFRLGLDILGLGGLLKLWLHGMAMFLVASYGLHLLFWLVQEYLLQFACLFGLLQVLVLSVSIQAGLEVEDDKGAAPAGRFVLGEDTDRDTPEPHPPEKPPHGHQKGD